MADDRKDIPAPSAANWAPRITEFIRTGLGKLGSWRHKLVTWGDLQDYGLANVQVGGSGGVIGAGPGVKVEPKDGEKDLTPPPTPTGFAVDAALINIFIEHDDPLYRMGHGHDRTNVYGLPVAPGAPLPTFADAVLLTTFQGIVFAYPANPSTTYRLWIKWQTKDGVESIDPAGGTNGLEVRTAEDPAKLLETLTGKLSASQLDNTLRSRIDLIDGGVPQPNLGRPILQQLISQDAINKDARQNADLQSRALIRSVLDMQAIGQRVTDAGIYVDPVTGKVRIYAIDAAQERLSQVGITLDALASTLSLKASVTYVDNRIAAAQLDPNGQNLFNGLDARINEVQITLDAAQLLIAQKASSTTVNAQGLRLTTAESNIDALNGTVNQKVNQADYSAFAGQVQERLGTAEQTLSAAGGKSGLASTVSQSRQTARALDADARTAIRGLLAGWKDADLQTTQLALARQELTAQIVDGLSSEAALRLQLQAGLELADKMLAASVLEEKVARTDATGALARSLSELRADLVTASASLQGLVAQTAETAATQNALTSKAVTTVQGVVTANAKQADALARTTLRGLLNTWQEADFSQSQVALARQELTTQIQEGLSTQAQARLELAALMRLADQALAASLQRVDTARVDGDGALAESLLRLRGEVKTKTDSLDAAVNDVARVQVGDKEALTELITTAQSAANGAVAAVQAEASTRATVDGYLGAQYTFRLDVAGLISGFGISGTKSAERGPTSAFGVRANSFYVAPPPFASSTDPSGPPNAQAMYDGFVWLDTSVTPNVTRYRSGAGWSLQPARFPFVVQTTPEVINGETVAPGIYADNAFFARLVATRGQIANLAVDDAKIADLSAVKLTTGQIKVGVSISSTGFISGSQGWRITGDGNAELQNATLRGGIFASYGSIGGITIDETAIRSNNYNPSAGTGFRIGADGTIKLPKGTVTAQVLQVGSLQEVSGGQMGTLNQGTISVVAGPDGSSWGALQTGTKWLGDGVNGAVMARHPDGSSFWELRAGASAIRGYELSAANTNGTYRNFAEIDFAGAFYANSDGYMVVRRAEIIDTIHVKDGAITYSAFAGANGFRRFFNVANHGPYSYEDVFSSVGFVARAGDKINARAYFRLTSTAYNPDFAGGVYLTPRLICNGPSGILSISTLARVSWVTYNGTEHLGIVIESVFDAPSDGYYSVDLRVLGDIPSAVYNPGYSEYMVSSCLVSAFCRRK